MERRRGSLRLFSVAGISIKVHWTFLLLFLYLFTSQWLTGATFASTVLLISLVMAVFVTVVFHEMGHALMARRYGCQTRDILLLPIGGIARMEKLPKDPKQSIAVALAGPLVNFLLAALLYLVVFRSVNFPAFSLADPLTLKNWSVHFIYANLVLGLFNLIPAFPMDGGRIFMGVLMLSLESHRARRVALRTSQVIATLMILAGWVFQPVWIILGFFVLLTGYVELKQADAQEALRGVKVEEVVMPDMETVSAQSTLRELADRLVHSSSDKFLVFKGTLPVGVVDRSRLLEQVELSGPDVFVETVMRRGVQSAEFDEPLGEVYDRMQAEQSSLLLVKKQGSVLGYLDMDNILEFVAVKNALYKHSWRNLRQKKKTHAAL